MKQVAVLVDMVMNHFHQDGYGDQIDGYGDGLYGDCDG